MAVRLLAGPFPLVNDQGAPSSGLGNVIYIPNIGILGDLTFDKVRVTLDGIYQFAGRFTFTHPLGWWPQQRRLLQSNGTDLYIYDEWALNKTLSDEQINSGMSRYIKLPDRYIYYSVGVRAVYPGEVPIKELDDAEIGFGAGHMGPGRHDDEVFIGGTLDGSSEPSAGRFYNHRTKEVSSPLYILPVRSQALVYAPEFGVMVSYSWRIASEDPWIPEFHVWSLEVLPTVLSDPELFIGPAKGGFLPTYRVRATGDHDEPCPDELVDWGITGVGRLLDTQTKTDEDGYATVRVRYGPTEAGDSTVSASLLC